MDREIGVYRGQVSQGESLMGGLSEISSRGIDTSHN